MKKLLLTLMLLGGVLLQGINYLAPGSGVWMQSIYMNVSMTVTDIEPVEAE